MAQIWRGGETVLYKTSSLPMSNESSRKFLTTFSGKERNAAAPHHPSGKAEMSKGLLDLYLCGQDFKLCQESLGQNPVSEVRMAGNAVERAKAKECGLALILISW